MKKAMEERYMNVIKWAANHTRLHTLWLQLHATLGKVKLWRQSEAQGLPGAEGWAGRAQRMEILSDTIKEHCTLCKPTVHQK